jgi:hypothetical protein
MVKLERKMHISTFVTSNTNISIFRSNVKKKTWLQLLIQLTALNE